MPQRGEVNAGYLHDFLKTKIFIFQPLDHPNIIKYIDSFIHNNELIIITEWAERGDLKKLIKNAVQVTDFFPSIFKHDKI